MSFQDMLTEPPMPHHCQVCKEPLDLGIIVTAGPTVHKVWIHPSGREDHEPDPVPDVEMPSVEVASVCDFCSEPKPRWGYKASSFVAVQWLEHDGSDGAYGSAEGWAACDACAVLIDADRFDKLLDRAMEAMQEQHPVHPATLAQRREGLAALHASFRAAKLSDRLPLEEA